LSDEPIREYGAGQGGWPTIRYFNAETGPEGAPYEKKTDGAMCDELGPKGEDYMTQYVEEAGKTSLCALDGKGCSAKQSVYITKMRERGADAQQKQLERLEKMKATSMTPELKQWLLARKKILSMLLAAESQKQDL